MITCIEKPRKFKNLTLNKEYEGTEDGDNYILLNDAGIQAKYNKKYFRAMPVSENIADAISVQVNINEDEDGEAKEYADIIVTLGGNAFETSLGIYSSAISCGIDQLQGIAQMKRECRVFYNLINHERYVGSFADMFNLIWNAVIENLPVRTYIMSDRFLEEHEDIDLIITNSADVEWRGRNHNSGNDIIFWIIDVE